LIKIGRFDTGEKTMLNSALSTGSVSISRIVENTHGRDDALRLLETLVVTALIDGDFNKRERAYIDTIATLLAIDDDDAAAVDLRVAKHLEKDKRLRKSLSPSGRVGQSMRVGTNTIEVLVRRNIGAIATELLQTGDLVHLLAKSVAKPLTKAENRRMKAQLLDLCKAVPALALFAAPGGTFLLPLLARALPFSLAPSSFKDDEEAAF
jgi:hypothetical protein